MATAASARTLGPWAIITPDLLRNVADLDPSALIIANLDADTEAASVVADVWDDGGDGSTQFANAVLIAAAPDLLDAVKGLLGLVQLISGRLDIPGDLPSAMQSNHRYVDAAALVARIEEGQ
jgi:hypothetical protein